MSSDKNRQYLFGGAVLAAVIIFIISMLMMLSQTNLKDITMSPGTDGMDWSYELISESGARSVTPVTVDKFTVSFTGESCRAVKASRTLKEELNEAKLGIYLYDVTCGVDMLLDDDIIYTSFEGAKRDAMGLAVTDGISPSLPGTVEICLPEDYLGRKLTVVTYFPSETAEIVPLFPYLCSTDTMFAVTSVENVIPIFRTALCAILAFLTALVYLLDISNEKADKKVLLLTLFYSMLTVDQAFSSLAGSYSLLWERLNILDFICELYIAPLMIFTAFSLTSWRRWILASATGVWFIGDSIKLIRLRMLYGPFYGKATDFILLLLYLLTAAMIIAEMKINKEKRPQKAHIIYAFISAAAAVIYIITYSAEWDWDVSMYIRQLATDLLHGYFYQLTVFISNVFAISATAAVFIEFARRTLRTRDLITALAEQNRCTMESYRHMVESEEMTYAIRHEMRHHMLALSGMLHDGSFERARRYTAALTEEYDEMPKGQYSKNTMVNIIAGSYLERARMRGVELKYSLNLPETLPISDTDLCVFVTNIFENAVNACEKMSLSDKRYIHVKMYINGSYLFIGCENSAPYSEEENKKDRLHGYGLENIKRIAKKYGGILKIDRNDTSFSVKCGLNIKEKNI